MVFDERKIPDKSTFGYGFCRRLKYQTRYNSLLMVKEIIIIRLTNTFDKK